MTGPELFALAHGRPCTGQLACFFCGAPADGSRAAADYVRDSFTGRNDVARPGSDCVCAGCVLCLREDATVTYPDGSTRRVTKAAVRMHSWVVTAGEAVAATKAHLAYLRAVCLSPPAPPYLISLAESGQKHVLYKSVVNRGGPLCAATLEGERVEYAPDALRARLALAGRVCAASGKPALAEPPSLRLGMAVCDRYAGGAEVIAEWVAEWGSPLTRLATFLCPNKETSSHDYPGDGHEPVPAQVGGSRGRGRRPGGGGGGGLFD